MSIRLGRWNFNANTIALINELVLGLLSASLASLLIYLAGLGFDQLNRRFISGLLHALLFVSIILMYCGRRTKHFALYWPFFICMTITIFTTLLYFVVVLIEFASMLWKSIGSRHPNKFSIAFLASLSLLGFVFVVYVYGLIIAIRYRRALVEEERRNCPSVICWNQNMLPSHT